MYKKILAWYMVNQARKFNSASQDEQKFPVLMETEKLLRRVGAIPGADYSWSGNAITAAVIAGKRYPV